MKNKILIWLIVFLITVTIANSDEISQINSISNDNIESLFENLPEEEKIDVIVVFKDEINETLLEQNNVEVKENLDSIDISTVKATQDAIKEIIDNPDVELVEPDLDLELLGTEENINELNEAQILTWNIEKINTPNAWNKVTGKNIKIAVLDTGINKEHPDLNVKGGVSFINDTNYWDDDLGHGTSVAGVISAENNDIGVVGVAPEAELYSIKVMDASGGKLSYVIQGIQWAIDNNMDIITMSLGIPVDSLSLRRIVDEAYLHDIILVAGSGKNNEIYYPAKYSSVIAVGSVDENNLLTTENGAGEELELVAPGKNIISTNIDGYGSFDGTSMAAPHVAGVAALLKENNPSSSVNELRAKLQRDAIDLGENGKDNSYGYGLVNINLKEENLSAIIQIVFPEEINETKKEELEINPIKVEIIKIENEQENIVQTLFYDGNQGTQNITVKPGDYKINQYFDDKIYSNEYNINDGDLIVVPLYESVWEGYLFDGPWQIETSDNYIPLLFGVINPTTLHSINNIYVYDIANNGEVLIYSTNWGTRISLSESDLPWFYSVNINKNNLNIDTVTGGYKLKAKFDLYLWLDNEEGPITIKPLTINIPKFNNWFCGDVHYHSKYTNTDFLGVTGELGAPIENTITVGKTMGLDWIIITDHSNAFNGALECPSNWNAFKTDCNLHNECLIGEEINCGYTSLNSGGNHYLGYNLNNLVTDNFGGCMPSGSNFVCQSIINSVISQGGFGHVAHPESSMDALGIANVINPWGDYSLNFDGLEIWNGDLIDSQNRIDLENGLIKWKDILLGRNGLQQRRVFISAGSDAHGEFNTKFGKEMTCVYTLSYSKSNIFNGLKNGNSYITNNGALTFTINNKKIGEEVNIVAGQLVNINIDTNLITGSYIRLFKGNLNTKQEQEIYWWYRQNTPISYTDTPTSNSYYRLEANDKSDGTGTKRVYTNPIWVNILPDSDGDGIADINDNCPLISNPDQKEDFDCDGLIDDNDPDDDGDNYLDIWENFLNTNPKDSNSKPLDKDTDGQPNGDETNSQPWMDKDDDGDQILDINEAPGCSLEPGLVEYNGCPDTFPPIIQNPLPLNPTNLKQVLLQIETNEIAECRFTDNQGVSNFDEMTPFEKTNVLIHNSSINLTIDNHTYNYYILCKDTLNNLNNETYNLTFLADWNNAPIISSTAPNTATQGAQYIYTITATDSDNDVLTYSSNKENLNGNIFTWTPTQEDVDSSPITVTFTVADNGEGNLNATETAIIQVVNVNDAPILSSIGNKSISENELLQFTVSATDPDKDNIIYSASNLPEGALFNSETRTFSWTPSYGQQGSYKVRFSASDGSLQTSEEITITVKKVNRNPVLNQIDDITVTENQLVKITPSATDPDGDGLIYIFSLPLNANGEWQTTYKDAGTYTIAVIVNDDSGGMDSQDVTITVLNDLDQDGTADINDPDDDNDGILDENDRLVGNSSTIDSNVPTLKIEIENSTDLNKQFNEIKEVKFKDNENELVIFNFDFSSNTLNLDNLEVKKQDNDEGSILIKGMPSNVVKSVYIDKLKDTNAVCILDEEISSITEISTNCDNVIETKLNCPGTSGDYSCSVEGSRYKITGLKHSGVKEFYVAPPSNPPSGGSSGGSSGGGGGGGGGGKAITSVIESVFTLNGNVNDIKTFSISKDVGIDTLSVALKNSVKNAKLTITKLDSKPSTVSDLNNVYKYIQIEKTGITNEDIKEANIKFKIEKSWISANANSANDIVLYRYTDKWEKLDTKIIEADEIYQKYEAITSGFSYFAIKSEKSIASLILEKEVKETVENETELEQQKEGNKITGAIIGYSKSTGGKIVIGIAIVLIAGLLWQFNIFRKIKHLVRRKS